MRSYWGARPASAEPCADALRTCLAEPLGGEGALIILSDTHLDGEEPAHVRRVNDLSDRLAAAGLLRLRHT